MAQAISACALLALALSFGGGARAEVPVPAFKDRVTDLTGTLNNEQQGALEHKLAGFEERKGSQIAVLLVPTTQPETIEQYSLRVVEQWKLGRKGVDDGALLLIAKDDRTLRIEVGYGLEGALPDVTARRIVDDIIVPRFRAGDFAGGIDAGVDSMLGQIEGEPLAEPAWQRSPPPEARSDRYGKVIFLFVVLLMAGHENLREMVGRIPAAAIVSGASGLAIWWLAQTVVVPLVIALGIFIFTLFARKSTKPGGLFGLGGWGAPGGGLGGGFGGGGGGFGGGGFSGRW